MQITCLSLWLRKVGRQVSEITWGMGSGGWGAERVGGWGLGRRVGWGGPGGLRGWAREAWGAGRVGVG